MVSVPRIKNSGARGEVMLFSGVGVGSFSRVGGGVRGGRKEWARMKVGEEGAGDGIAGVEGAADFRVAIFMAKLFIARIERPRWSARRISGLTLQLGRNDWYEKSGVSR